MTRLLPRALFPATVARPVCRACGARCRSTLLCGYCHTVRPDQARSQGRHRAAVRVVRAVEAVEQAQRLERAPVTSPISAVATADPVTASIPTGPHTASLTAAFPAPDVRAGRGWLRGVVAALGVIAMVAAAAVDAVMTAAG